MKFVWALVPSLLLLASAGAGWAADAGGQPLPPLPGADVTARTCTACHSPEVIVKRGRTPDQWSHTVDLMIRFGAKVDDADKQTIVTYLSQAFPPKPAPAVGNGDPR